MDAGATGAARLSSNGSGKMTDPGDPGWLAGGGEDEEPGRPAPDEAANHRADGESGADEHPPGAGGSRLLEAVDEPPARSFVDFAPEETPYRARVERRGPSPLRFVGSVLLPLAFSFFLTCLFLGMRGILDLGGFVARGGPYEIAHPAPDWWWVMPLSIIACIVIVLMSVFKPSLRGINSLVLIVFWPALFISLGWNFLEYGFFKGQLAWGWIICGLVFVPMGAIPLYLMVRAVGRNASWSEVVRNSWRPLLPQLVGIIAGIPLGVLFFRAVS